MHSQCRQEVDCPGIHQESIEETPARDAATVLEFLAWGRRKDPDCHTDASLETEETGMGSLDNLSLAVLQLLLPSQHQVQQLVEYHIEGLLWYHCSFFASTFQTQLRTFYDEQDGVIRQSSTSLQWTALLFSILTASMTCAPAARVRLWGFGETEQATLSQKWFQAISACLTHANYTSNLSILSCQAIATATTSAHLLGFSTTQSIHLATAVRIAQSLGLHRLSPDVNDNSTETGRRVWCQLCTQDWFSIPFSDTYLVSPKYSTLPDYNIVESDQPTTTSYSRFLYNVAIIMPQLQDNLVSCNTPYTRYEKVLYWDNILRGLATRSRPPFMTNGPLDPTWPLWVPWARHALAINSSPKIIMIHRSFLLDSFENPAFAFTRRTCLAASKTIIKEYKSLIAEDGPTLWIHQAFAVAASITLCLDILYRDASDEQSSDHQALVKDILQIMQSRRDSMIAIRGTKLLGALLAHASQRQKKRKRDGTFVRLDISTLIKQYYQMDADNPGDLDNATQACDNPPSNDLPDFSYPLSFPLGANGFDNLLYLANYDLEVSI